MHNPFEASGASLPQQLAVALRQLAQAARAAAWGQWSAHGLSPTQREILELLRDAEATAQGAAGLKLSEIARRLHVTAATASQSLQALQAKTLVVKAASPHDARAVAIRLSPAGRKLVRTLARAPDPLQHALRDLSPAEQEALYTASLKMIRALQQDGALPASGLCTSCAHFEPHRFPDSDTPHYCRLVQAPFGNRHLRLSCPEHEAADPEVQRVVWMKFTGSPANDVPHERKKS